MSSRFVLPLVLAALVLGGCTGARESEDEAADVATVRVENRRQVSVVVYAVRSGGQRRRLGRVSAYDEEVFELPPTLVSQNGVSLRFQLDILGVDRPPISRETVVYPGDQVELVVPVI